VAHHGKDFLFANDPWFRGIAIDYGPDGGVYVSDWCDTGECHNYQVAHATTGRIYKVVYGQPKAWRGDLANLSDKELADLQDHRNVWQARHARRILQERALTRKISPAAIQELRENITPFRALWALHAIGELKTEELLKLLHSLTEIDRIWAMRLLLENEIPDERTRDALRESAFEERSPLFRLHLAGAMQKVAPGKRFAPLHQEDADDPFLPLMCWYAQEPHFFGRWLHQIPLVREFAARRAAEFSDDVLNQMISDIPQINRPIFHRDILRGIQRGLSGRRQVPMPMSWEKGYQILIESPLPEVRERALTLAVQFGDERALTLLRKIVPDHTQSIKQRAAALKALLLQERPDVLPLLRDLLQDDSLRSEAIRGLASFSDSDTSRIVLGQYSKFTPDEKADAVHTLASRPSYALALLDAVADKTVARADLNAFTVRQLLALNDKRVTARVNEVWGTLRPASQEKAALMAKYKKLLTADTLKQANLANGRLVYTKNCAACHKLFGEGGAIGPELTGSQRANLDYVLENMLDPSAVVPREYQVSIITTDNGRTLTGIIKEETERALTVQTQNEVVIIPKSEIESRRQSNLSMMPEGILDRLTIEEIRDLVAYLASPAQAPLPMR
jgi:putative heme-binding domain-containing protein